jgi:hypothetical protein
MSRASRPRDPTASRDKAAVAHVAPITSVLIIIEMTGSYGLTSPLMISNMVAYVRARRLRPTPIYEALLEQDGIRSTPGAADPTPSTHSRSRGSASPADPT